MIIYLRLAWCVAVVAALLAAVWPAVAGGGPENVMLVVNRESQTSRTIANYYQAWRKIPPGNVVAIPAAPNVQSTDIDTFRQKILDVVLREIEKRRLGPQIDYIVYSSDFPTAVDLAADVRVFEQELKKAAAAQGGGRDVKWPVPPLSTVGSITGLTYLWAPVTHKSQGYFDLRSNAYMRRDVEAQKGMPTIAFSSRQNFGADGELLDSAGRRYMLSVMLGVTAGRGNTRDEVLDYLKRAVMADGAHPKGTIYFAKNADVRSRVRHDLFPTVVRELKAIGVNAEIVEGILPMNKDDVQGAMIGTADFDWQGSKSRIRPGAICEHFTSWGGVMTPEGSQTPISVWLRFGAAGTSGTVTEPYAILDKFPAPSLQLHYARGCSLAEAFYQSVFGPYQLLIVGDPLCQPWASIPQVKVEGAAPGQLVSGKIELKASATVPGGGKIDHFELFVDELRRDVCGPTGVFSLDTTSLADGWHELRVVAVEASLIRSQGRAVFPVTIRNRQRTIEATLQPTGDIKSDATLTISAKSPGSSGIVVLHNGQIVGRVNGAEGKAEFKVDKLGKGPVTLRVVGMADTPNDYVWAQPFELTIQ